MQMAKRLLNLRQCKPADVNVVSIDSRDAASTAHWQPATRKQWRDGGLVPNTTNSSVKLIVFASGEAIVPRKVPCRWVICERWIFCAAVVVNLEERCDVSTHMRVSPVRLTPCQH